MKTSQINFWGKSKYWWIMLIVGILLVLSGFAYWLWPAVGFAVSSQIFGWMLVLAGIVQICASAGVNRPRGWGWWLVGGIIDLFIGFMLVRSIVLSEEVFPYFIALIFAYWGISAIMGSISEREHRYWWVSLINGILMLAISYFFIEAGWQQDMFMVSFITSLAFIYWGFTVAALSYNMRPMLNE